MGQVGDSPVASPSATKTEHKTMADIESMLTPIGNDDFNSLKAEGANQTQAHGESSATEFADAFEVPKVLGMQKSLRVKKKKRKFFLFRWFSRDND